MKKGGFQFPKKVVDEYFLMQQCPYSKRRAVNMRFLGWSLGFITAIFILGVLFLGGKAEQNEAKMASPDYAVSTHPTPATSGDNSAGSIGTNRGTQGTFAGSVSYSGGSSGGGMARNRNANQVVRRNGQGNDPGSQIPMGSTISAKLVNAVVSTDSATPVIALISDDAFTRDGTLLIPAGTQAIGQGSYDENSQRIQVRFGTLVYPDGDQHSVQGMGMMLDGSAGLIGELHSGAMKRQTGRFLSHFIGGLAEGMKDRAAGGLAGIPFEPGSIKNGVLNGVTLSAEDQAKTFSDNLGQTRPSMSLSTGQAFLLYFEREYAP